MSDAIKLTTIFTGETSHMETLVLMRAEMTQTTIEDICNALGLDEIQIKSERFEQRGAAIKQNLFNTLSEDELDTINGKKIGSALYQEMLLAKNKLKKPAEKAHVITIVATKD